MLLLSAENDKKSYILTLKKVGGHSGRSGSFRAGWWSKITIFQIDFKFAQEVGFYA